MRMRDLGTDLVEVFHQRFRVPFIEQGEIDSDALETLRAYAAELAALAEVFRSGAEAHGGEPVLTRLQLMTEELAEVALALAEDDVEHLLKELSDLSYVVDGTWISTGLADYKLRAMTAVHDSNMSKLGTDGLPITDASGRVVKGPHYQEADMARVLSC